LPDERKVEVHIEIEPRIHKLQIATRYLVATNFMGNYASAFKGVGIEFADFRKYEPSDDASLIDWNASLRARETLVRKYQEERNVTLMFLLDCGATMLFGSHEKLKHEFAAELVASMTMGALGEGDCVGMSMFNDRIVAQVRPSVGRRQLYLMFRNLVDPRNYGGVCDYANVFREISSTLPRRSIVMLVSDFIGLKEQDKQFLRVAGRKYDLTALVVRDPRDNELPAGLNLITVSEPNTGEQLVIDVEKIRDEFAASVRKELGDLEAFFKANHIDYLFLNSSESFVPPVINFLQRRQKKIR
jgi:uncharacterized protein (DUF58 family)